MESDWLIEREDRIQELVGGDVTDNIFVTRLIDTARNENDDHIRVMARCILQEKSFAIITRLLDRT